MNDPYTYSNLLTERSAAVDAEYKREIRSAVLFGILAFVVVCLILL